MNKLFLLVYFFFFLFPFSLFAQLNGKITDESGEPLPFASIYLENSTIGTTCNIEGDYELRLQPGTYRVVFQFIGYQTQVETVQIGGTPLELNVVLKEASLELDEVVVRADQEDPAYAVIRKAIEKRSYYLRQVEAYTCQVYIKGNIKFLETPEAILGQELGDLGGLLDSNGQGIIYLSESLSNLSFMQPARYKEEMVFSKVSGDDQGFGFNNAQSMDFNLYENFSEVGRRIISPIAENALAYYRYRLEGVRYDEQGRLINQIRVIPKRGEDPTYFGTIYIIEDLWNIYGSDLYLTAAAMKQPGLDTLNFQQTYVPVVEPDLWRLFSQVIRFKAGALGFELGGAFSAVYSNYDLEPALKKADFSNEVFRVEEGANTQTQEFWDSLRPIPLTQEESVDYVRKDSLEKLWESKTWLDSVDRENNKFTLLNLLGGYTYDNSFRNNSFTFESPLTSVQFNTVQGWNADIGLNYYKGYDDYNDRWLRLDSRFQYGFSDNRLRVSGKVETQLDQPTNTEVSLSGGVEATQFNDANPITPTLNSLYSLFGRENYMKIYDLTFVEAGAQREILNGLTLNGALSWNQRSALTNNSDYSFSGDEEEDPYTSNNPLNPNDDSPAFNNHEAWLLHLGLRLVFKQEYVRYPDRKFVLDTRGPVFSVDYTKGLAWGNSAVNFDHLRFRLRESYMPIREFGYSDWMLEGGWFPNDNRLFFMDARHFMGNQTFIGTPSNYYYSFFRLPYYDFSTVGSYGMAHFQHRFDGWLLDRVPGIRKLGFKSVVGAKVLATENRGPYWELHFGLDNIGIDVFRAFRVDGIWYRKPGQENWQFGIQLGIGL